MSNGGRNGQAKKKSTQYDRGFREGYLEGLSECGPITGFTQWFSRRAASKKLGAMKEAERHAVVTEALAEYESEGKGAKKRLLGNPSKESHHLQASSLLKQARAKINTAKRSRTRETKLEAALAGTSLAARSLEHALGAGVKTLVRGAGDALLEGETLVRKIAGVKNPSKAGAAAIGGIAGGVLLGPLGAAAGGYTGVKLKQRAETKKAKRTKARKVTSRRKSAPRKSVKRKKNPDVGRLVRDALK
ncbi:MAG: hypothetical protein KAJ19_15325 [Gammaproteobacteria bacterium]|nr:hypothetical protein [Gammaproteobacteria bacterium]